AWEALVLSPEDVVWQRSIEANTVVLDPEGLIKVAGKDDFVGRRRYLQRGLKALKSSSNLGIWLHGLGGVGKSTILCRLLDRLTPMYERVVIVGTFDGDNLKRLLREQCKSSTGITILDGDLPLTQKLALFLENGLNKPAQRLVFVLDDFEQNIEAGGDGKPVLKAEVVEPLTALFDGIFSSKIPHRVIVTSQYDVTLRSSFDRKVERFQVERMDKADVKKLSDRLESFAPDSDVPTELQAKAQQIADGYPRLLKALDKMLKNTTETDSAAILAAMSGEKQEFLAKVLAAKLLAQQEPELQQMLARGAMFELPVPLVVLQSICTDLAGLDRHVDRSTALGLLETGLSADLVRVPKVLDLEPAADLGELAAIGVKVLHQQWIEQAKYSNEAQRLEIHRLAMLGGDGEIAVKMAQRLSQNWVEKSRHRETVNLCQLTVALQADAQLFSLLARAERNLGNVTAAEQHCLAALKICPDTEKQIYAEIIHNLALIYQVQGKLKESLKYCQESIEIKREIGNRQGEAASLHQMSIIYQTLGDFNQALKLSQDSIDIKREIGDRQGEAASLHQMSMIYQTLGDLNQALQLSQDSIEIKREIGNRQGEAASLHQMSMIYETLGDLNQALQLSQDSIDIKREIGDRQGEAGSLAQMASIARQQGDPVLERELRLQAAVIRGSIGDYGGLVITLRNLGANDEPDALGYLAQSLWLTVHCSTNLEDAIALIVAIYNKVPSGDSLESLLGATACYLCHTRSHPQLEQLIELSNEIIDAASQQEIETPADRDNWKSTNRLDDPNYFLPQLLGRLEAIVGDAWLFDRSAFVTKNRSAFEQGAG
uniref:tetratricopeptide repeat protein n=1 Tax=Chamaesiphon sp. VAR_69_metabat_338 TaxID=2964704 RepID=UPI00286E074F